MGLLHQCCRSGTVPSKESVKSGDVQKSTAFPAETPTISAKVNIPSSPSFSSSHSQYLAPRQDLHKPSQCKLGQGADAWAYVMQSNAIFDMICIDIFIDDKIPNAFLTEDFLQATKDLLHPKGILIFNHLSFLKSDIEKASKYYDEVFSKVFSHGKPLLVSKNTMMISNKDWLLK